MFFSFFEIFLFRPQIQESFKSTIEHIFTIFHIMCIRYPKWNQNHLNPSNNIIAKCIPCSYVAAFEKIYIFFKDLWDTLGWRKRKLQCGNVPSLFEVNLNRGFSSHYYLEDWMHVRKFIQIALVDTNMFFLFCLKQKKIIFFSVKFRSLTMINVVCFSVHKYLPLIQFHAYLFRNILIKG